jgi:xanthine dehydrogenase accessory factor
LRIIFITFSSSIKLSAFICADGTCYGTIGGGCGESVVRSAALRCLLAGKKPERLEVSLLDELGTKGGDVCGGKMWIFIETI